MPKLNINNGGVDTNKKMPDIDERFGPYTSIEAANAALGGMGRNTITAGLTVGILTANAGVKEWWYQPNKNSGLLELIPKGGNAADNPTEGNFASFDSNGNVVDSGNKATDFAPADQAVPMGDTEDVGKVLEKQASGFGWVPKPVDGDTPQIDLATKLWSIGGELTDVYAEGKSALQIYNDLHSEDTPLTEAEFIDMLKATYPMKYVGYDGTADAANVGDELNSLDSKAAGSTYEHGLYLMPNADPDIDTPTGSVLFICVNKGEDTYKWVKMGDFNIPYNVVTDDRIDDTNLDNPSANSVAKASDVVPLKVKLKDVDYDEIEDATSDVSNGYIKDGIPYTPSSQPSRYSYRVIDVSEYSSIRFLGMMYGNGHTRYAGYAFYDSTNDGTQTDGTGLIENSIVKYPNYDGTDDIEYEFVVKVPTNAKWLFVTSKNTVIQHFYAYKGNGEFAVTASKVSEIIDNTFSNIIRIDEEYEIYKRGLNAEDKWTKPNGGSHITIPATEGDYFEIYNKGEGNTVRYAVVQNDVDPDDDTDTTKLVDYADGFTENIQINAGKSKKLTIHTNGYLVVNKSDTTISEVYKKMSVIEHIDDEIASLEENVNTISDYLFSIKTKDFDTSIENISPYINKKGTTICGIDRKYGHFLVDVDEATNLIVKTNKSCRMGWLVSDDINPGQELPMIEDGIFFSLNIGENNMDVPNGAKYAMISAGWLDSDYINRPYYIGVIGGNNSDDSIANYSDEFIDTLLHINNELILGNKGTNEFEWENFVKKVKQMTGIKWTPKLGTIKKAWKNGDSNPSQQTYYEANTEYTGIPYSGNGQRTVGFGVSFEAFMTAINNKYSLMYTEDLQEPSLWGDGVRHEPTNQRCHAYYGTYCNGLVYTVLGYDIPLSCRYGDWVAKYTHVLSRSYPQWNEKFLKKGDVFMTASATHAEVIFNVVRNENGEMTDLYLAEATGSSHSADRTCIIQHRSGSNDIKNAISGFKANGYVLYKHNFIFTNIDYTPSPFIPLEGETPGEYTYNNDVCTFAGNKSSFITGDLVVVNYNLNDDANWQYTHLYLYDKDDSLIHKQTILSIDESEYPSGQQGHAWAIPSSLISNEGKYKVKAGNGTDALTEATEFEVISDEVVVTPKNKYIYNIEYKGENDIVGFCLFGTAETPVNSKNKLIIPLPYKNGKTFEIYPVKMLKDANIAFSSSNIKIALFVKTKYGVVVRTKKHVLTS